jgi:hypothetical protein
MRGGGLSACSWLPRGGARKAGDAPASGSARRRRCLFGNARGRFRTRGRNSVASVRGTRWSMTDSCRGTLTRVTQGTVIVRDLTLRRNRRLRAGDRYLAKPPRRRRR